MRKLIIVHFKRFWFRWETFAVTLWNLLLGLLSAYLASQLYFDRGFNSSHNDFVYFYLLFTVLSLCGTMSAVLLMETANLNSGALRNYLLGGYTKTQIVVSKFFVNTVFGMMQGLLFVLPVVIMKMAKDMTLTFLLSAVLLHAAVSGVSMIGLLLAERPSVAAVCCIFGFFFLAAGSVRGAKALDEPQYKYSFTYSMNEVDEMPNLFYVSEPERTVLEAAVRLDPMQPVYEYIMWYLPITDLDYDRWEMFVAPNKMAEMEKAQYGEKMQRHKNRIRLLPYYQLIVLAVTGICGTLIFRKRNLK